MIEDIIDLKNKYLKALKEILALTEKNKFTKDEDSCQSYIRLIENRNIYFDYLSELDTKIKLLKNSTDSNNKDVVAIDTEIKQTAQKLISLDIKNKAYAESMLPFLKNNLKSSKNNRKIFSGYNNITLYENSGIRFDSRQ